MAGAFTDISELTLYAEGLNDAAADLDGTLREFVRHAADDVADRMRREVPKDSRETERSITVNMDSDGLGASIGPTNVDNKGRPVGFFIEYGTSDTAPDPFVRRTSTWAEAEIPDRAADALREIL